MNGNRKETEHVRRFRSIATLLAVWMLASHCATPRTQTGAPEPPPPARSAQVEVRDLEVKRSAPPPGEVAKPAGSSPASPSTSSALTDLPDSIPAKIRTGLVELSKGRKGRRAPVPSPSAGEELIKVEPLLLDKADIAEVTNLFFGKDFLDVNYVMDPALRGQISLYLEGEYTRKELLNIITKAYNASNISIVPKKGIYYIQPIQRNASSGLPLADRFVIREDEEGVKPAIIIYRLRYLDAKQAVNVLRFFLTPGRPMTVDPASNSIIFAEETENARTLVDLLKALDMDLLNEVGMEIVPLQALTPADAVKSIETLMNKLDIFKQTAIKSNLAFLPLEQFGGVLILGQDPEVLKTAKEWLVALDVQGQEIGEQVHVYFVQNGLAKDIADILDKVFDVDRKRDDERPQQQIVEATQQPAPQPGQPPQPEPLQTTTTQDGTSTRLTGEVAIIADEVNNAIVVKANPFDYEKIRKAIETLDIVPRIVMIEVTLAEVTLGDDLEYGVEWYFKNKGMTLPGGERGKYSSALDFGTPFGGGSGADREFTLGDSAQGVANAIPGGFSFFWGSLGGDIAAMIRLLSAKTNVKVLSTPTLLATDNKEASITVGGREPVRTGTTTTSGGNTTDSIQYEDTGIILNVTPHINSGGLVRMEVEQTLRRVADATTEGIQSPRFDERVVKTSMLAQDGQTVIIGGIIQESHDKTKSGIPLLMNVPLLSPLFSTTSDTVTRTELVIAITPHIIRHGKDEATREFLYKLNELKGRMSEVPGIQRLRGQSP